ncbi:MAG: TrkH family potassium uptake protein [Coriobacteriia bacterium]|nr:TrkH family potassium uptake protein [Coriobacteriia bacterium]
MTPERHNVRAILHYTGMLVLALAAAMIVPLVVALISREWDPALDYILGAGVTALAGALLVRMAPQGAAINRRDALLVTALAWLAASLAAAVPLAFSGHFGSYLDACFEAMSGLTTSGLVLVQDLDHIANAHNVWRHFTHLIGGQGIIVAALSVAIGMRGGGAMSLYLAEGRDERIMPNVLHTARFIWLVTAVYVGLGIASLTVINLSLGMGFGRSVLHAFCNTAACWDTGGFGPQSQNSLYYHSAWYEGVTVILMIAGTMNFNLHAHIWRGERVELVKNIEARTITVNTLILSALMGLGLAGTTLYSGSDEIIRKGIYHLLSATSGTGQQTLYPSQWTGGFGGLGFVVILMAMAFGGMASSTAGGIKTLRIGVAAKGLLWRIRSGIAPQSAVVTQTYHHFSDVSLNAELFSNVLLIFLLYVITYITGGVIGMMYGYPPAEALFESISAAANVGLSTGITNPAMPAGLKIVYMIQMWAGRLEFLALFAIIASIIASITDRRARA